MENSILLERKVFLWYECLVWKVYKRIVAPCLSVDQLWDERGRWNSASITCISRACKLFGCFLQTFLSTWFHYEIRKDFFTLFLFFETKKKKFTEEEVNDRLTKISVGCIQYDNKIFSIVNSDIQTWLADLV